MLEIKKMALVQEIISFISVLVLCMTVAVSARGRPYTTPKVKSLTNFFSQVRIDQGFSTVFGLPNIKLLNNGSSVNLALDKNTGSGLASKNRYDYGFFSAAMKLPSGLCPGVVVAFYLSNADKYPHNHDEIDIEILGHDKRYTWVIQTNVYVNGSSTGREEKFYFWFDPTKGYHHYSIIWNNHHTVFLIDNIPVREFVHSSNFPSVYPSKAMSLYATIWDGSEWATHGGKYPVNYKNAPFVVSFAEMQMTGCVSEAGASASDRSCSMANPSSLDPVDGQEFAKLSTEQVSAMDWARRKLMFYSYCNDKRRFKVMPPECK